MGDVLIGLDGGGTHTRVLVCDPSGNFVGYAQGAGCNPENRPPAECVRHARDAVARALAGSAGGARACGFVAGIAGLTAPGSADWAREISADLTLGCAPVFVGDNVVALEGAFGGRPGIVACAGTGSIVFCRSDQGREVCNFDLSHNAQAGAWWLCHRLLSRIAAMEAEPEDTPFVEAVLSVLGVGDISGLRQALLDGILRTDVGALAPLTTDAALRGLPLAQAVCDEAATGLARGVRLLGPYFAARAVPVAPIGSVACSGYVSRALERALADPPGRFAITPALYPPVVGAMLLAASRGGHCLSPDVAAGLAARVLA